MAGVDLFYTYTGVLFHQILLLMNNIHSAHWDGTRNAQQSHKNANKWSIPVWCLALQMAGPRVKSVAAEHVKGVTGWQVRHQSLTNFSEMFWTRKDGNRLLADPWIFRPYVIVFCSKVEQCMSLSIHAPLVPVMSNGMDFNPLFINFGTKH